MANEVPRRRAQFIFTPEWEGPIKNWTMAFISSNYWRFSAHYEQQDLVHEAYLKFMQCCSTYPRVVEPAHFAALYRTAVTRRFITLAKRCMKDKQAVQYCGPATTAENLTRIHVYNNSGFLMRLVREAPTEVRSLLKSLLTSDVEVLRRKFRRPKKTKLKPRETTNDRFCELLGLDPNKINVHRMALDHFDGR